MINIRGKEDPCQRPELARTCQDLTGEADDGVFEQTSGHLEEEIRSPDDPATK